MNPGMLNDWICSKNLKLWAHTENRKNMNQLQTNPDYSKMSCMKASNGPKSIPQKESLPLGVLSAGRAWNTSTGRCHRGILVIRLSHLNWLFSMWRSSGSTSTPSWMTKLLTQSLRESRDTLQRKIISPTCICDLVLSITTQSLWP